MRQAGAACHDGRLGGADEQDVAAHHTCTGLPDGGTRVELRVVMSGALGGVVGRLYRRLTDRYLAMEAAGLEARAEGSAP